MAAAAAAENDKVSANCYVLTISIGDAAADKKALLWNSR
jgi:hypothetical protein